MRAGLEPFLQPWLALPGTYRTLQYKPNGGIDLVRVTWLEPHTLVSSSSQDQRWPGCPSAGGTCTWGGGGEWRLGRVCWQESNQADPGYSGPSWCGASRREVTIPDSPHAELVEAALGHVGGEDPIYCCGTHDGEGSDSPQSLQRKALEKQWVQSTCPPRAQSSILLVSTGQGRVGQHLQTHRPTLTDLRKTLKGGCRRQPLSTEGGSLDWPLSQGLEESGGGGQHG